MNLPYETSAWDVDVDAWRKHVRANHFATVQHNHEAARDTFKAAFIRLDELQETDDVILQRAKILRDINFSLPQTMEEDATPDEILHSFSEASQGLIGTAHITERLLQKNTSLPRRMELLSEHGDMLSHLGRLVVLRQATFKLLPTDKNKQNVEALRHEQRPFGKFMAHSYLRQGSLGHKRVSNAMHCARAEQLNGKPMHSIPWLGRAAVGMAATIHTDRQNLGQALKSIGRIGWSMRSKQTAVASIFAQP